MNKFVAKIILNIFFVLCLFNKTVEAKSLNCILPQKIEYDNTKNYREIVQQLIVKQFEPFMEKGITRDELQAVSDIPDEESKKAALIRLQIIDNKLYGKLSNDDDNTQKYIARFLNYILKKHNIKNVDFVMSVHDAMPSFIDEKFNKALHNIPTIHFHKSTTPDADDKNLLLFPDHYVSGPNYPKEYKKMVINRDDYKWESKIEKIMWIGGPTGSTPQGQKLSLPRFKLVLLSEMYPEMIDAKFSYYVQFSDSEYDQKLLAFLQQLYKGSFVALEEHLKYKYLIVLDGNTGTAQRGPLIMLSGSVPLIQYPHKYLSWYYPAMKPWVHYVPVNWDLSDIFEKYNWLKNHDEEAKIIAQNAKNFAEQVFVPEYLLEDFALFLNTYAKIQKFTIDKPTLPSLEHLL